MADKVGDARAIDDRDDDDGGDERRRPEHVVAAPLKHAPCNTG